MELKHSNLKVRPGASPQRVAFFGEHTVHTGNLLRLVCTNDSNITKDKFSSDIFEDKAERIFFGIFFKTCNST